MSGSLLTQALVGLPLAAAALMALWPGPSGARRQLAVLAAAAEAGLVLLAWLVFDSPPAVGSAAGPVPLAQLAVDGPWLPGLGADLSLAVDGVNLYTLMALAAVLLLLVLAEGHVEPATAAGLPLGFATAGGLAVFLLSRDLLLAAAGHGLAGLSLAGLIGCGTDPRAPEAGRRFAVWAASGTLLLTAAAVTAGQAAGSTGIDSIAATAAGPLPALLMAAGLALQIPLIPFHTWLAPVCAAGSAAGRVLVLGAWCGSGIFGVARFGFPLLPGEAGAVLTELLLPWGLVSAAYGAFLLLAQADTDLARRLGWACVAAGGLMMAGLAAADPAAVVGAFTYAAAQAPVRACLVLWAACIAGRGGGRRAAAVWAALALALIGVPGSGAFAGGSALLGGLLATGGIAFAAAAATGLATLCGLLLPSFAAARRPRRAAAPDGIGWIVGLTLALAALSGARPGPFMDWARADTERLLAHVAPRTVDDGPAGDEGGEGKQDELDEGDSEAGAAP